MKYNTFKGELKEIRTISHLLSSMIEILEYTNDKVLADFIANRLLATLNPDDPIDSIHVKKIYKIWHNKHGK